ncbi:MAG: hypothetical protein ACI9U2_001569 [Bradymonadia bacterium]|jgi:hypothetical protein
MTRSFIALALLAWGCDSDLPPQITACDQLALDDAEEIATFLTLNNGLTCDFADPADGAQYACNRGPLLTVCGAPSDITTAGCNCIEGEVECFERQDEADRANEMCGS